MAALDIAIIVAYLVATLALGVWLGRRIRSGKDYFLGGRTLPWWAIGMSLVVSDIGAKDIIGVAQDSYRYGWVMTNWDWVGCIPAMILAGVVFVPYFWAGGFYTVPEYFGRRFHVSVRILTTIVWGLFIAGNIGVIFSASTEVLTTLLGIDPEHKRWVLLTSALVVGIYTFCGGLAAVVYTDVIQCVLMIGGMACVLWLALEHPAVGGWDAMSARLAVTHPDHLRVFHPPENPSSYTAFSVVFGLGMVMGPAYWIGNQVIVQRVLGARSLAHARGGVFFGALLKSVFPILLVVPGILALSILPETLQGDEETKQVFPRLVRDLLPTGVRGLVFAAMIAGMMGNLDSYLNSASTLWTRDFIRYLFRSVPIDDDDPRSARLDLVIGRTLTVVFLVVGVIVAPYIDNIFKVMQWMLSIFQGPSLALLLLGMFWRRATPAGGLLGLISGLATSAVLNVPIVRRSLFGYDDPYLHVAWWSFVSAVVVVVIASLATRPLPTERLEGLVWGTRLPTANEKRGEA